jgi:hypothetical protein
MYSIRKIIVLVLLITLAEIAQCQPVTVNFIHKQNELSTVMTGLSDSHLFTVADSVNLNKILSLYFSETLPDSTALAKLNNLGIMVYLKNKRQKIKSNVREFNSPVSIGFGFGIDYGGLIGAKVSLFPAKPIGGFIGFGDNTVDIGYNFGIDWKFTYMKRTSGFLAVMYGYNAVVKDVPAKKDEAYYGLSGQVGARMRVGKQTNYLSLGIIIPITQDSEIKDLKKQYGDNLDYSPVLFSLGFHFGL